MTYAKFTEDGALDWTSGVPQEGLEAVRLPLVNAGDEIIRDGRGRISVRRKERGMAHTSSPSFSVLSSSLDNCAADAYLLALSSYAPPAETGGEKVSGISVLIPCYGKAAYIEETVASVLAQDEMPEEIKILLMDGKSAEKKERLEGMSPVVRCTVSGKLDVCEARNRLARECGTEWFIFLDADDMLAPGFIRTLSSSGADFIFPAYRILRNGKTEDPDTSGMNAPCVSGNLTGLFRRDAFFALGGLDSDFAVCGREDTDFILTALESGMTVRAEKNSFYILRRDDGDAEWTASSFTQSETYKNRSRESADKILAKHREGIKKNFRTRGVFTGCHMPTEETVLLRRYAETGDNVHLLYLLTNGKMQGRDVIVRQTVARFFSCTDMDFRTACPGRDFSLCPEFDGDFSQWVFKNCEPTEEERARISDHCMGMSFDVLFLSAPVDGVPGFPDVLTGAEKVMIHRDVPMSAASGARFRFELYRDFFCAHFPLYDNNAPHFSDDDLIFTARAAGFGDMDLLQNFDRLTKYEDTYGAPAVVLPQLCILSPCSAGCEYCLQRGTDFPGVPSEEAVIAAAKNAVKLALEKTEACGFLLFGGEPGEWSDGILSGLADVFNSVNSPVQILTNGSALSRPQLEKIRMKNWYIHALDWHGRALDFSIPGSYTVIVNTSDLPYLRAFCEINSANLYRVEFEPCRSTPYCSGILDDMEALEEFASILSDFGADRYVPGILAALKSGDKKEMQKSCRDTSRSPVFVLNDPDFYHHCCNLATQKFPLSSFGLYFSSGPDMDCGECFMPCNFVKK